QTLPWLFIDHFMDGTKVRQCSPVDSRPPRGAHPARCVRSGYARGVSPPDEPSTELLPAGAVTPASEPPPVKLIRRALGKFVIIEKLGRGGSGDVFRAEQQPLGRSVVIKVLRREVATGTNRVERFLREAKLASRLDHPYAAHVYAFGAEPDGLLWIAMEH